MFFFSALSFGEGGFDLAASHGGRATGLPLFFCGVTLFDRGKRGCLRRIRVTAHAFIIPAMKEFHVDIELIKNPRHSLIDNVVQRLGPMIKSRHGRKNHGAHSRQ